MTRKHFQKLADAMKHNKPIVPGCDAVTQEAKLSQWARDCEAIADACKSDNSNFKRERFLTACGV